MYEGYSKIRQIRDTEGAKLFIGARSRSSSRRPSRRPSSTTEPGRRHSSWRGRHRDASPATRRARRWRLSPRASASATAPSPRSTGSISTIAARRGVLPVRAQRLGQDDVPAHADRLHARRPRAGSGRRPRRRARRARGRRKIGYVPETVPLYGHMRVGEFLRFMARLRGVAAEAVRRRGRSGRRRLLALGEVVEKPVRVLSRGFRQRTAIAQALVHDPEIVVLDEPTNGLDPRQIIEMRGLIRGLAGRAHRADELAHSGRDREDRRPRRPAARRPAARRARRSADTPDLEAWFLSVT